MATEPLDPHHTITLKLYLSANLGAKVFFPAIIVSSTNWGIVQKKQVEKQQLLSNAQSSGQRLSARYGQQQSTQCTVYTSVEPSRLVAKAAVSACTWSPLQVFGQCWTRCEPGPQRH